MNDLASEPDKAENEMNFPPVVDFLAMKLNNRSESIDHPMPVQDDEDSVSDGLASERATANA